jgi:hypothetical protein
VFENKKWLKPTPDVGDITQIWQYAITVDGYKYAKEHWKIECADLANSRLEKYNETGKWEGSFEELRCCLFFEQRRYRHFGDDPKGKDLDTILALYQAIINRWNLENKVG